MKPYMLRVLPVYEYVGYDVCTLPVIKTVAVFCLYYIFIYACNILSNDICGHLCEYVISIVWCSMCYCQTLP